MLDVNIWRIECYLSMEERPEKEEQEQIESKELEFYTVTDSKELPF